MAADHVTEKQELSTVRAITCSNNNNYCCKLLHTAPLRFCAPKPLLSKSYATVDCFVVSQCLTVYLLLTVAINWLKEQSPLTPDDLQTMCINMDDFRVCMASFLCVSPRKLIPGGSFGFWILSFGFQISCSTEFSGAVFTLVNENVYLTSCDHRQRDKLQETMPGATLIKQLVLQCENFRRNKLPRQCKLQEKL